MRLVSGYILNEILSEGVLIPIGEENGQRNAYCLNETGCFLLKKLEHGCEKKELVESIMRNFDVEEMAAEKDVSQFLTILENYHLLKKMSESDGCNQFHRTHL